MGERKENQHASYVQQMIVDPPIKNLMQLSLEAADRLGKSHMCMSPWEARTLQFLIELSKAQKVLEIGTLTGYTGLWMLSALGEQGELVTLEKDPLHAAEARKIFSLYTGPAAVHLWEGDALEQLPRLAKSGPFDLIFIDANKSAYGEYLSFAEKHLAAGGILVADNVFLGGRVPLSRKDPRTETAPYSRKQVATMHEFNQRLLQRGHFSTIILPFCEGLLVGVKQ